MLLKPAGGKRRLEHDNQVFRMLIDVPPPIFLRTCFFSIGVVSGKFLVKYDDSFRSVV